MANWLQELYAKIDWRITLLVPVPLGRERMRQRGYNQAGLVASALADILNLRMEEDALRRIRETRSQVGLNEVARKQNVEDAFAANVSMVQHEHILLIDDLITSGATLSSCAETLWDAGAAGVYGFTIAKA
jgi:ComF family protein